MYRDHSSSLTSSSPGWRPGAIASDSSANCRRASSQTDSESTRTPSRSKTTPSGPTGSPRHGRRRSASASLNRRLLARPGAVVADRGGEGSRRRCRPHAREPRQQVIVAAEGEPRSDRRLETACRRAFWTAWTISRARPRREARRRPPGKGHGVACLRLYLVALQRLHHQAHLLARQGVVGPSIAIRLRAVLDRGGDRIRVQSARPRRRPGASPCRSAGRARGSWVFTR